MNIPPYDHEKEPTQDDIDFTIKMAEWVVLQGNKGWTLGTEEESAEQ